MNSIVMATCFSCAIYSFMSRSCLGAFHILWIDHLFKRSFPPWNMNWPSLGPLQNWPGKGQAKSVWQVLVFVFCGGFLWGLLLLLFGFFLFCKWQKNPIPARVNNGKNALAWNCRGVAQLQARLEAALRWHHYSWVLPPNLSWLHAQARLPHCHRKVAKALNLTTSPHSI